MGSNPAERAIPGTHAVLTHIALTGTDRRCPRPGMHGRSSPTAGVIADHQRRTARYTDGLWSRAPKRLRRE